MNTNVRKIKPFYSDFSLWALMACNLIVIVWALLEGWSLAILMFIYWTQSVFIGIFWFLKILTLKEWPTDEWTINGRTVDLNKGSKIEIKIWFPLHYGFFQFGHFFILREAFKSVPIFQILLSAGIFLIYQCFSFFYNKKWEAKRKPKSDGIMMLFPYARIVPMHVMLCIGLSEWGQKQALALFLFLKLLADMIMHMIERGCFTDVEKKKQG